MGTYVHERVLEEYCRDNYKKFRIGPTKSKILYKPKDNKGYFPDLGTCYLDDGSTADIEVEWTTDDYLKHGHDTKTKKADKIVVLCLEDNGNLGDDIIVELISTDKEFIKKDFLKWYQNNLEKIMDMDSDIQDANKHKQIRKQPKTWICYFSEKEGKNWDKAVKSKTWGYPTPFQQVGTLKLFQEDDLIVFIGPFHPGKIQKLLGKSENPKRKGEYKFAGGRVSGKIWKMKRFHGYFEKMSVYRITSGYEEDTTEIWPARISTLIGNKGKPEYYPHRFKFDPIPLLELEKITINKLSQSSKEDLHPIHSSGIKELQDSTLIDILYHSKTKTKQN